MNAKISMKQIRCFVVVSEELNFTRSASRLNMTQAPLTRQIQMLEDAVGARLFHRSNRSVSLTREGRIFQPYALRALGVIDAALSHLKREPGGPDPDLPFSLRNEGDAARL